uniref:DnaJ domain-containing protein n=1 Tax=Candidatus Kentrum sp. MB TaxID=2138164 RepID=A0A450Y2I6_9GAMM|nr:MAG: DnaJ domain-containing protein [Candidatus Kentron sp. MB]VFK77448.1 MAG: DnaJ domain-containing protein [Candidatus Kentron sp. MB]
MRKILGKRREIDISRLFDRDLPMGDKGWKLEGHDAPPLFPEAGSFAFAPLFRDPHPNTTPIQLGVARKLFELMGVWYIPRRLRVILTKLDAFQGVSIFLRYLRFDFQDLLRSREARERFNRYLNILMDADEVCQKADLSDLPVYDALESGNIDNAEGMLDLLHKARRIHAAIVNEKDIIFPAFREEFVSPALSKIAYWEKLDEDALKELVEILNAWQDLQDRYKEITGKLIERIRWIDDRLDPAEKPIKRAFHGIVEQVHEIQEALKAGLKEAADGIEKLETCYAELTAIYEYIKGATHEDSTTHEQEDDEASRDREIQDCLKTLELSGSGKITLKILKSACRKLRSKYHPDRPAAPSDATERTKQINVAYDFLNDCLARGVELHA